MYTRDFTFYEKLIENASELGANCIVAKDLLPPEFYTAVSRFNKKEGNSKVYIMQQIRLPWNWLNVADPSTGILRCMNYRSKLCVSTATRAATRA